MLLGNLLVRRSKGTCKPTNSKEELVDGKRISVMLTVSSVPKSSGRQRTL